MTDIDKFYSVVFAVGELVCIVLCIYQEIAIEELEKRISYLENKRIGAIKDNASIYHRIDRLEDDYGELKKAIERVRKNQNRGRKQSCNLDKPKRIISSAD